MRSVIENFVLVLQQSVKIAKTECENEHSMKKQKISLLKKKADKLFSLSVRKYGKCQFMGLDTVKCSHVLQCAHIETRGTNRLRHDQQNALCLCSGHHWYYTNHPGDFDRIVQEFFPSQWKYVQEHKKELVKRTVEDYQNIIKELEAV